MNKKHLTIIIFQLVVILILGMVLFMRKNRNIDFLKASEDLLKDEIEGKEISIRKMGDLVKKADKDFIEIFDSHFNGSYQYMPFSHPHMLFVYYNEALSILDLMTELEEEIDQNKDVNTKKIIDFSEDNFFYITKKLKSMIESLNNPKYSSWKKKYILLFIKNHYLQKCISKFDESSIPLAYGQVMNYAERDTVNLGEIYRSQVLFNVLDATGNIVIFENGDTLKYGNFEEIATKKGHNSKKGYMEISYREGTLRYGVNIDYYVK